MNYMGTDTMALGHEISVDEMGITELENEVKTSG